MWWSLMVPLVLLTLTLLLTPLDALSNNKRSKNSNDYRTMPSVIGDLNKSDKQTDGKDEKVLKAIESNLLTLFGFSKRPRPNKRDIVIPETMLELYKQQTGMDLVSTNLLLPGRLTRSANTVRSYTHQESPIDQHFRHSHRFRLSFSLDKLPKSEALKAAELHIKRVALKNANHKTQQVLVHDIIRPGVRGKYEPITRLIDSKGVQVHLNETLKLDVSPAVERWLENPKNNHGLLVVVLVPNDSDNKQSNNKHIRLKRDVDENINEWRLNEPVLYTFTDDGRYKQTESLATRSKRAIRKYRRKDGREHCRRHELYVDFTEVGWNDWIVAPPGYDAFYCSGDCPFPLSDHFNSTNHAIVQTLVNSVHPSAAPKACCVPTTLTSISMLYLDEENNIVLKNYQDMTVVGCGCR